MNLPPVHALWSLCCNEWSMLTFEVNSITCVLIPSHLLKDIAPEGFLLSLLDYFPSLLGHQTSCDILYCKISSFLDIIFFSKYSISFLFVASCLHLLLSILSPVYSYQAPLLKMLLSNSTVTFVWPNETVTSCRYLLVFDIAHHSFLLEILSLPFPDAIPSSL